MTTGKFDPNPTQYRILNLLMIIPALIGVVIGIRTLVRGGIQRWADRIFLFIGLAACGFCSVVFGFGFFN
jgi:hypothetical protein